MDFKLQIFVILKHYVFQLGLKPDNAGFLQEFARVNTQKYYAEDL